MAKIIEEMVSDTSVILNEDDIPGAKLMKEVNVCSVVELKRWLECRGQKRGGKKNELIKRVYDCVKMNLDIDPKIDGGKWYYAKKQKLNTSSLSSLVVPEANWKMFPSFTIPSLFNYGHVYHYLIESTSQNEANKAVTSKALRKGKNLLLSSFVEDVHSAVDDCYFHLRANVHHSMKSDYPLNCTASISKLSGFISKCSCTCIANATGRCAHVAALLLFLSDYVDKHGSEVSQPCTSFDCQWNRGKKGGKNPQALHLTKYASLKRNHGEMYKWDPRKSTQAGVNTKVNREQLNQFVSDLQIYNGQKHQMSMWESILKRQYKDFDLNMLDIEIYAKQVEVFECYLNKSVSDIVPFNQNATCVPGTEKQRDCDEWFIARWPRVTASLCKSIVRLGKELDEEEPNKKLMFNWIKNNFWYKNDVLTSDMLYGVNEESNAIRKYEGVTGLEVSKSGLWVNKNLSIFGASPDGIIFQDSKIYGVIEVKCLKILRERTVAELLQCNVEGTLDMVLGRQCFRIENGNLKLKKNHSYYFQVQMQLLVTEASFCDFVLHSGTGEPHIERIYKDDIVQNEIVKYCYKFWKVVLLPEYFIMRVPRSLLPVELLQVVEIVTE